MSKATLVLVPGSWHGAWCWQRVQPLMEAHGYAVLAVDMPASASTDQAPGAVLAHWAEYVAGVVREQRRPTMLVGHSRGGLVISQAAEWAADALDGLIYLSAFLIPDGQTVLGMTARLPNPALEAALVISPDGTSATLALEGLADLFYHRTAAEWLNRAAASVGPEPMSVLSTPLRLSDTAYGSVPRAYVEAHADRAIPLALQRLMQKGLPCNHVDGVDSDHSPFFSEPEELAAALDRCAQALLSLR